MVPISYYLILSGILFACGVTGFLIKRNIITIFMSIELMLNGVNLSFVAFAAEWKALALENQELAFLPDVAPLSRPATREDVESGLVVRRDQRAHSSLTTSGSSRCSTACTRARNVSMVSSGQTGTRSALITEPVSIPSST